MKIFRSRLSRLLVMHTIILCGVFCWAGKTFAAAGVIHYFPTGPIYDYRWKLLDLALSHAPEDGESDQLVPYAEEVTQNRGIALLQSGAIDVIALGTNDDREKTMRPIKIDILRGIVGFRILIIRSTSQARIAKMDDRTMRKNLVLGLNSQWADLPVLRANGFSVTASPGYENLFDMLAAGRFDAFPRGLNEAWREMNERRQKFPQLKVENTKAFFFAYPVYFWVRKDDVKLAERIEHGLRASLADGSFRQLFESYHAQEIATAKKEHRHIIRLTNPVLPEDAPPVDTSWWWPENDVRH